MLFDGVSVSKPSPDTPSAGDFSAGADSVDLYVLSYVVNVILQSGVLTFIFFLSLGFDAEDWCRVERFTPPAVTRGCC